MNMWSTPETGTGGFRKILKMAAVGILCAILLTACAPATQEPGSAPAQEAVPSSKTGRPSITLVAVGDVLLARRPGASLAENGKEALFGTVQPRISGADLAFANLESSVSPRDFAPLADPYFPIFRTKPAVLDAVLWAGFDVVSVANNHVQDAGPRGVGETVDALEAAGLAHTGAGRDGFEAWTPAIVESKGYRIAFIACTYEGIQSVDAASGQPGQAIIDRTNILASIFALRHSENRPDFIIVSLHWGDELAETPAAWQRDLARDCLRAGATAVFGHHPHVLQGVEAAEGGIVLYSMGNFVFDMKQEATNKTVIATLRLGESGFESLTLEPLRISAVTRGPGPAQPEEAASILDSLVQKSSRLGTTLVVREGAAVFEAAGSGI